jgi:hypothetical protein
MTPSKGYSSGGGLIIDYGKNIVFTALESDEFGNFSKFILCEYQ